MLLDSEERAGADSHDAASGLPSFAVCAFNSSTFAAILACNVRCGVIPSSFIKAFTCLRDWILVLALALEVDVM